MNPDPQCPGTGKHQSPSFELIDNVKPVYDIIRDAQKKAIWSYISNRIQRTKYSGRLSVLLEIGGKMVPFKLRLAVFLLILIQVFHSIEEYMFRFYDQFPVFRFYTKIYASIPQGVFVTFNVAFVLLLLLGFLLTFFKRSRTIFPFAFALLQFFNGLYHGVWSLVSWHYFPGTVTGLLFLPVAFYVLRNYRLIRNSIS